MKKIVVFFICFVSLQTALAKDVRLGLRAGINLADQQIDNEFLDLINYDFDSESRLGWQAGLVLDAPFREIFSFQPALMLSSKGYQFEDNFALGSLEITARPLYINLPAPVLAHAEAGSIGRLVGLFLT